MGIVIGRKEEIEELTRRCESDRAEFVAVYGRRRVGKTFLINEVLGDDIVFRHTGLSPYDRKRKVTLKAQLQNFQFSLIRHGMEGIAQPKSWMLGNIINNKGGLYGRLTCEMKLKPFTLLECEQFFESRKISMSRYNTIQAYMILGGIPFYLDCFNPSLSLAQNIDSLFFNPKARLGGEFERLFNSVFDNAAECMAIIRLLGKRHAGYRRDEIARRTGINPNGDLTKMLKALIASDFITRYVPYGVASNMEYYKLSDCFCWFWLHFKEEKAVSERDYWLHHLKESEIAAWRGVAFEEVCLQHIQQIKMALQIAGVTSRESALVVGGDSVTEGMQIDLLIDRADDVVNVCEMKYSKSSYVITKDYADKLQRRVEALELTKSDKTFLPTMVTVNPIVRNAHSDIIRSVVTVDDLFK